MKALSSILILAFCLLSVPAFAEKPPELNKMRFEFEIELAELIKPLQDLNAKYSEHLEKQKAAFQQAGNLEAVLAIDAEIRIFEADLTKEFSSIPELKRLQEIYREQTRKVNNEIIRKKLPLIQSYSKKAKELSVQWTKEGKLDDAKIALAESKRVAAMASDPSIMNAEPKAMTEKPAAQSTPSPDGAPATATKEKPFVNSLGMQFVQVPITGGPTDGQTVLFSVWETRVKDYRFFLRTNRDRTWPGVPFSQTDDHPAVNVSWEDGVAFCEWLTEEERKAGIIGDDRRYRLPTDHEWSCAVGIGKKETAELLPRTKHGKIAGVYPWGGKWPPPKGAGNFFASDGSEKFSLQWLKGRKPIEGYEDGFDSTAPVGSFEPNDSGLYDLSGNAWEWCADWYSSEQNERAFRGGSWGSNRSESLQSSNRNHNNPSQRNQYFGFRCVLAK